MPEIQPQEIIQHIQQKVAQGIKSLYQADISPDEVNLTPTRKEFEGDYTLVVFPFARVARKKPEAIGEELGAWLISELEELVGYNVIKGFLNLSVSDAFWTAFLERLGSQKQYGFWPSTGEKTVVEFSSPNTNKPLHLGHIRNILLGWSISRILEAAGQEVVRVQIVNDRGIAICKSMLAWQMYGEGVTPESSGVKGDHLVGEFYVLFEKKFQEEYSLWQTTPEGKAVYAHNAKKGQLAEAFFKAYKNTYFNEYSHLGAEAKQMLLRWEAGEPETVELWKQMNNWVYAGFGETYDRLGVSFDKLYYESQTYLLGKDLIARGLEEKVFYEREDGSVWADLEEAGLDQKLVLRSDGTSVYITQDLGTAHQRYLDFKVNRMVYVVADEQNYHFQVLFELLKRLGEPYADQLYHLAYGMVDLPSGRMKSREGTVVDADELMAEVIGEARVNSEERGEITVLSSEEQEAIIRKIGLAALKFHIIKVQPRKRMVFDPKESVDLQGQTGPYVQNAYVRIRSVLRKAEEMPASGGDPHKSLLPAEKELLKLLYDFPAQIRLAADELDPSAIAQYAYNLAKTFHRFYHDHSILRAETAGAREFRLDLASAVAGVLESSMELLGIEMPERM